MASVGKHIRRLRTEKHMTQEDLAEKLFVTRQAVSAWETEKALPDIAAIERIADALGADVNEVIYGVRQAPDLKRIKRKWSLIGFISAIILFVLCAIPLKNGALPTWQYGLQYHLWNANYTTTSEPVPGEWSVELDLQDPAANAGKILYEDESGCRIVVEEVSKTAPYQYRVHFRAHGVYNRSGGQLVSGSFSSTPLITSLIPNDLPCATASVSGLTRECPISSYVNIDRRDGNSFVFHLSSTDSRNDRVFYTGFLEEQTEPVTFAITGLTRLTTRRISYWDTYPAPAFLLSRPLRTKT